MRRSRAGRAGSGGAGGVVIAGRRACEAVGERALPAPRRGGAVWRRYLASPGVSDRLCGGDSTDREIHVRRRLLLPVLLALPLLDPGAASAQAAPAELRWTRVPAAELERYEATVGGVRVNNFTVAVEAGREPAGPATAHEFGVSVANRGADRREVEVQIIGARQDGTPTLAAQIEVDVEPRRNESQRVRFYASEAEVKQTAFYQIRVLTLPDE